MVEKERNMKEDKDNPLYTDEETKNISTVYTESAREK